MTMKSLLLFGSIVLLSALLFKNVDGTVYITTAKSTPYFASVDTSDGSFSKIAQFKSGLLDGLWYESAVDVVNLQYAWFMQSSEGLLLALVDINEGSYTTSPNMWSVRQPLAIDFDPIRNVIYQMSYSELSKGSLREFTTIDLSTWNVTVTHSWGYNSPGDFIDAMYDYKHDQYYLTFSTEKNGEIHQYMQVFDMDTLNFTFVNITPVSGQVADDCTWNFQESDIVCITHYGSSNSWGLLTIDPMTGMMAVPGSQTFSSTGWSNGIAEGYIDSDTGNYCKGFAYNQQEILACIDMNGDLASSAPFDANIASLGCV